MFWFLTTLVFLTSLAFWYAYYSFECWLNGGFTRQGNPWLVPFSLLAEETLWLWPWGIKFRADYVRKLMDGWEDGYMGDYSYAEIREQNLYAKVGAEVLPGWEHFLFTHVATPFGPTFIFVSLWLHCMG